VAAGEPCGVDLPGRKNEAICGGVVEFSFELFHIHDVEEVRQVAPLLVAAFFLERAKPAPLSFHIEGGAGCGCENDIDA
jgi:hypothetical protein